MAMGIGQTDDPSIVYGACTGCKDSYVRWLDTYGKKGDKPEGPWTNCIRCVRDKRKTNKSLINDNEIIKCLNDKKIFFSDSCNQYENQGYKITKENIPNDTVKDKCLKVYRDSNNEAVCSTKINRKFCPNLV